MGEQQVVVFRLDQVEYAVSIEQVQEIINVTSITRVPRAPEYIRGVLNLRGRILPVIDLKKRLNIGRTETTPSSRIVVAKVEDILVGVIVDAVEETTVLKNEDIESVPTTMGGVGHEFVRGIGKHEGRLLTLLDLAKIIGRGGKEAEPRYQAV